MEEKHRQEQKKAKRTETSKAKTVVFSVMTGFSSMNPKTSDDSDRLTATSNAA